MTTERSRPSRWRRSAVPLGLGISAITVGATLMPVGVATAAGTTTVVAAKSGRCLDTEGGSKSAGTKVTLAACDQKSLSQKWTMTGTGQLRGFKRTRCLTAKTTTVGTVLTIETCGGTGKYQKFDQDGDALVERKSTLCVMPKGQKPGGSIVLSRCNGQPTQDWSLDGGGGPTKPPAKGSPVKVNGQLHVCGTHLCNQYDNPIQLRGMSTHGIQWFPQCYNDTSVSQLAKDWGADIFRIAMYVDEEGYVDNRSGLTQRVNDYVDLAEKNGMYAIIDFHTLTPGDPNIHINDAKEFFGNVAPRNAKKKNVIYEIANEPNGVSWDDIKRYATEIIPVIREADPDAVIIVGTPGWSSLGVSQGGGPGAITSSPLAFDNIMYTFHFYAASHGDSYRSAVEQTASQLPIMVTEWGTVSATGSGSPDLTSSAAWIDLLDRLKISHMNWTFSDHPETSAALTPGTCGGSDYSSDSHLKDSGKFVKSRISTPDDFATD